MKIRKITLVLAVLTAVMGYCLVYIIDNSVKVTPIGTIGLLLGFLVLVLFWVMFHGKEEE